MATAYNIEPSYAELHVWIEHLDRDVREYSMGAYSVRRLRRRVDALCSFAAARGYSVIGDLAGSLGDELARWGRAAMVRPYLEGLREAASGDPSAPGASAVYLAAVGVRLN